MNQNIEASPSGKIENNVVMPYTFSIDRSLTESWYRISGFKASFWGAFLIAILFQVSLSVIGLLIIYFAVGSLDPAQPGVLIYRGIVSLIAVLASFPLYYGLYFLGIKQAANLPVKSKMIFGAYRFYWRLLGVIILQFILMIIAAAIIAAIVIGLMQFINLNMGIGMNIAMIILGVIVELAVLYLLIGLIIFSPYLVMDKNVGVFRAFKLSFQGFKQHGIKIFLTLIITSFIVASTAQLLIGLIWTLPFSIALIGVIYRTVFGVTQQQ